MSARRRLLAATAALGLALAGLAAYRKGLLGPGEPMKKMVFRKGEGSPVMTLYRIGSKYGRLEQRAEPGGEPVQVIVVREPEIWQIDPKTKIGRHSRDTGPFLNFHSPIVPPDPGSSETLDAYRSRPISSFEFGRELEFMWNNSAVKTGDRYDLTMDGLDLAVLLKPGTDVVTEVRVAKDKKTVSTFLYDSYEPALPADLSLFRPPKDVRFLESDQEAASPKEQGPGETVPGTEAQQAALKALKDFSGHPWKMVFCGPLLWKKLLALDAGLAGQGAGTAFLARGEGGKTRKVPVRRFLGAGKKIDDAGLYSSKAFQTLAAEFSRGKTHPASKEERAALYGMIPFEIAGRPVTMIEAEGETLVFFSGGGLLWLDLAPTR